LRGGLARGKKEGTAECPFRLCTKCICGGQKSVVSKLSAYKLSTKTCLNEVNPREASKVNTPQLNAADTEERTAGAFWGER